MSETIQTVSTRHADVAVRQSGGNGLPLLLLHGNSSCKEVFHNQMTGPLAQTYRLIAMDLPGHGASSDAFDPTRSYSIPGYADAAVEVLSALGIEQAAVFGWSLGGHVAIEMMATFPGLSGVMITGTPPVARGIEGLQEGFRPNPELALAGQEHLAEAEIGAFARTIYEGLASPALTDALRRTDGRARSSMVAALLAGAGADQRRVVETSPVPLAIVNGADEPFVNTGYLSSLSYANLWDRKCYLIPRLGHAPFLAGPDLFNHILARFMRNAESAARRRGATGRIARSA